jgi:ribonuclease Y
MGESLYIIIAGIIGLGIGAVIAGLFIKNNSKKMEEEAKEKAKIIMREAEINAEALKKDVEKKINDARKRIEEHKQRLQLIDTHE